MGPFTPEQVAAMAQAMTDALPETADVVRPALTADGFGGQTAVDVVVASVPCRRATLYAAGAAERAQVERIAPTAQWKLTVPAGTEVRTRDALVVAGVRHEVVGVLPDAFGLNVAVLATVND